jgi:pimeloyl-ACP methyl ester carboxylesterase
MPVLRVGDVGLYYEERGSGPAILGIHGTGSSAAFWTDAAEELATRGRTIVYDRRGFSRSGPAGPRAVDVHRHADDAAALLDALEASPAIVIGRSQGGEIAVDLALRYPDRVRALALLEGGGLSLSPATRAWLADLDLIVYAAAAADVDTVGEAMIDGVLGDGAWAAFPEAAKQVFSENGAAIVAEHRGGLLEVTEAELGSITQPTLIVGAVDSGPELADATRLLAAAVPAATVEWVEGGHLIHPSHPAILRFVDDVLAAS